MCFNLVPTTTSFVYHVSPICLHSLKLEIHKIIPIFKAGDKTLVKNYRPISLLSSTSKVLEQLVFNKVVHHLVTQMGPCQLINPCRTTASQLLIFFDLLTNSPTQVDTIYLDVLKAFDTISYGILLTHLRSFGIIGPLWSWFKFYLTNQVQQVYFNNILSDTELPVISGVPHGSILGPLFLLMYMNNILSDAQASQLLKFADDMRALHLLMIILTPAGYWFYYSPNFRFSYS